MCLWVGRAAGVASVSAFADVKTAPTANYCAFRVKDEIQMENAVDAAGEVAVIMSSDGHAMAEMAAYREYLPANLHASFDDFLELYKKHGVRSSEVAWLVRRLDMDVVDDWRRDVIDTGRLAGDSDPHARIAEMDRDGRVGDCLFPDFGMPFELGTPLQESRVGYHRNVEHFRAGQKAYNRWLSDFVSVAPERFAGMATVNFEDVEGAVTEIKWAREAGLRGVLMPAFDEDSPLFSMKYEPIWSVLEALDMPLNIHPGPSSVTTRQFSALGMQAAPHPGCVLPIYNGQTQYLCHQILTQLIWGGVLERHPRLRVVITETGSGWVRGELLGMDYSYEGSYLRRDLHEVIKSKPSDYFERQCFLGSSIFSRAEVQARHQIGVNKMMLGADYPHHEGTWWSGRGTVSYLQATLGAANVPVAEARLLLGRTAVDVFGMDLEALTSIAERIGAPSMDDLLTPADPDRYPRGDVNKPLSTAF
jgi:predicted TIM-barrel fold metal-dependent hydrolase